MSQMEYLKEEIERERRILDEMLATMPMESTLVQSQKLDRLMQEYLDLLQ
ncbi:MAG: hypothetical protein ACOX8M_05270 [Marvinbryantia sp.]|jgi:hypothetical protein